MIAWILPFLAHGEVALVGGIGVRGWVKYKSRLVCGGLGGKSRRWVVRFRLNFIMIGTKQESLSPLLGDS
jgi:hypothetical protein